MPLSVGREPEDRECFTAIMQVRTPVGRSFVSLIHLGCNTKVAHIADMLNEPYPTLVRSGVAIRRRESINCAASDERNATMVHEVR
jgi:hypothetical protein